MSDSEKTRCKIDNLLKAVAELNRALQVSRSIDVNQDTRVRRAVQHLNLAADKVKTNGGT